MSSKSKLTGKLALVTGVTGDIGLAITESLLNNGVKVLGISLNKKKQNNILRKFKRYKNSLYIINFKLEKIDQIEKLCMKIKKTHGVPDIIVNSAAEFYYNKLERNSLSKIINNFNLNVISAILISKSFIKDLKKQKWGRIINICSSSAYNGGGTSGHCVYSATKHALLGFSRALDEEVRTSNIRVGTISPAGVKGNMTKKRYDIKQSSLMEPSEVSDAVNYLINSDGNGIIYEMRIWRMKR